MGRPLEIGDGLITDVVRPIVDIEDLIAAIARRAGAV
jgi:hypothetical protein